MEKNEVFLLVVMILCSLTTNVAAENSLSQIGNQRAAIIPYTGPQKNYPVPRRSETLQQGLAAINISEEMKFQEYLGGILPAMVKLQGEIENSRFDDTKGIDQLRSLMEKVLGEVKKIISSTNSSKEKYSQIKAKAPEVVEKLKEIGGKTAVKLAGVIEDFKWH